MMDMVREIKLEKTNANSFMKIRQFPYFLSLFLCFSVGKTRRLYMICLQIVSIGNIFNLIITCSRFCSRFLRLDLADSNLVLSFICGGD